MRRWLCLLCCLVLLCCLMPVPALAREVTLASQAAVLMDGETGHPIDQV